MSEEQTENDLSGWYSTYGLITANRILARYKIKLNEEELLYTLKNPETFYYRLLKIPLKNVFNGIILQQARDYQLYVQKLFIDYFLSGETSKNEEFPGAHIREQLEENRKTILKLNASFRNLELKQEKLIAESQYLLIEHTEKWHKILEQTAENISKKSINLKTQPITDALIYLLIHYNFKANQIAADGIDWTQVELLLNCQLTLEDKQIFTNEINSLMNFIAEINPLLADFGKQCSRIGVVIRQFRTDYYNWIITIHDLLKQLPEYRIDDIQDIKNRESLHFDPQIGEEKK